jgi:intracellular multiplication protein IcmE
MVQLMSNRTRGTGVYSMVDQAQGAASGGVQQTAYQQGGAQAGGAGAQAAVAAATPTQYTLIGAGDIQAARVETGVNTDIGGDFGATLLTGKYAGAKLIGSVQRRGETAQMTVRMMSMLEQGVSVPAAAVILDAETAEGGTATEVDRKLFIKYGIKPIAAGFAAVADYLKNSGTTVVVNGETVTSSQPELTNKKAAQIIAGSAAQQVNTDANALDTTPTVRVRRGAIVGVFFTQDVLYTPKK